MPASLTYPGVYIDELPSGVHTITGVATSIAAFIGWAAQGPTDEAALVESWGDFQTQFGGLNSNSFLGYSVNQFFANGGQQAYIVRLVATTQSGTAATATAPVVAPTTAPVTATTTVNVQIGASNVTPPTTVSYSMDLAAANPGSWGNCIAITVTVPTGSLRFGLQVSFNNSVVEKFVNLSFDSTDPQYVLTVINNDSQYITLADAPTKLTTTTATSDATKLKNGVDGTPLSPGDPNFETALLTTGGTSGLYLLDRVEIFNLLCVPGETEASTVSTLQMYCASRRALFIMDAPQTIGIPDLVKNGPSGYTGQYAANSALYFPWVLAADPLFGNRPSLMPPCGFVAGIYGATDTSRGVWKAPAGIDAGLSGALGLQYNLTDDENGSLNMQGVNCLRNFKAYGNVVWGARTLLGSDQIGSQWKYVPIRRLALFIESSLFDGTQWVVFEPNDETLWGQIRMNVGAFMQGLFLQGAFQGTTPQQAYFVKCDSENNPQSSIDLGIVNVLVGFAPVYPAEFVVIQIQQIAGQL